MAEITRLSGRSGWIELDFMKRERTPSELMKLAFDFIWLDYRFRIQFENFRSSMSSGHGKPSTIGCRKPIYSPPTMQARITLHSTKR